LPDTLTEPQVLAFIQATVGDDGCPKCGGKLDAVINDDGSVGQAQIKFSAIRYFPAALVVCGHCGSIYHYWWDRISEWVDQNTIDENGNSQ
jgi:hypothetical protein